MDPQLNPQTMLHTKARWAGLDCLCHLLSQAGHPPSLKAVKALLAYDAQPHDLLGLIQAALTLGFDPTPLEGPFSELPSCPFPVIAVLPYGHGSPFVVVEAADDQQVRVFDPASGHVAWPAASFKQRWQGPEAQGDVLALAPGSHFPAIQSRLNELSTPLGRLKARFGWGPPWPSKLSYAALLSLLGVLLAVAPAPLVTGALALALAGSLWSWFFGKGCGSCHGALKLSGGLPLAELGVTGYALLLALTWPGACVIAASAFAFLAGAHLTLMAILFKARIACWACATTALGAWLAAVGSGFFPQPAMLASVFGGILIAWGAIRAARYHQRLAFFRGAFAVAQRVWSEEPAPQGQVRAVVYKRQKCSHCLRYQTMIGPALRQTYPDQLLLEERDATGLNLEVPLMIVCGHRPVLVTDLRGDNGFELACAAIDQAMLPLETDAVPFLTVFPAN